LKRVALKYGDKAVRGEALVTAGGIEGGAVYALAATLRDTIDAAGAAELHLDLRPDVALLDLAGRLSKSRGKQSLSTFLRRAANLSPVEIGLLHESARARLGDMTPVAIAALAKDVPIRLIGVAPIATAISTAGGISWDEVDARSMLNRLPGVFVAGEMLDWEAPTGGYLLQACFSTGALAARGALDWLAQQR
jgi:predicted flavoprotein YhiN